MNIQFIRWIIENDYFISKYIKDNYSDCFVKYSNFWFILIKKDLSWVYKFYLPDAYYKDLWIIINWWFYKKEIVNYISFKNYNILIPEIYSKWKVIIWKYNFSFILFENIRRENNSIKNFLDLDINDLVLLVKNIHSINKWYIHWNFHPSNFFVKNNNLWIFDFINYSKWNIEKDIARIIFWFEFKNHLILKFLNKYGLDIINKKILIDELLYIYWKEKEDIKFNILSFKKTIQLIKLLY